MRERERERDEGKLVREAMGLFNMFQKEKICTSFAYHCACRKRNSRLPVGALCMFEFFLFFFLLFLFLQTSRQGSLNRYF